MEVKKAHCFFEQSGTFKNEFIKLGIPAEDYDIQDNFGETDHVIDLFKEIDDAYDGKSGTVFDNVGGGDIIIAFYPCIYFCAMSQMAFSLGYTNYRKMTVRQKVEAILKRSKLRDEFYCRMVRFTCVCLERGIRMVMENPWSEQTYLKANMMKAPDLVDMDRTKKGDYFKKPTAYWFWNCTPENGFTYQKDKEQKTILSTKGSSKAGLCSEDRSMINPDYARNWIKSYIIGEDDYSALPLLDAMMEGTNGR